jgi:hypothetical protein
MSVRQVARDKINTEHFDELVFQPVARGRAAEELPVLAKRTPDVPRVGLDRASIEPRHPKASGLDALRGKHSEHVVIGNDQELCRVGERDIVGEHLRFHMPVHADQGQVLGLP